MAIEKVKDYFKQFNMEEKIIELKESSATVKEAALALGCREAEIAKTLSFSLHDRVILIVMAGNAKLDNSKYKKIFHEKSKMLDIELVESVVGHAIGGVCPFAINPGIDVYLDNSLKDYEIVYPACGSGHSAIPLTIKELEHYSNCKEWIDVSKQIDSI